MMNEGTNQVNSDSVTKALIKFANLYHECQNVKTLKQLIESKFIISLLTSIPNFQISQDIVELNQHTQSIQTLQTLHRDILSYLVQKSIAVSPKISSINLQQIFDQTSPNHTTAAIMFIFFALIAVEVDQNSSQLLNSQIQILNSGQQEDMRQIALFARKSASYRFPTQFDSLNSSRNSNSGQKVNQIIQNYSYNMSSGRKENLSASRKYQKTQRDQMIDLMGRYENQIESKDKIIKQLQKKNIDAQENWKILKLKNDELQKSVKQLSKHNQQLEDKFRFSKGNEEKSYIHYQSQKKKYNMTTQNLKCRIFSIEQELIKKDELIISYEKAIKQYNPIKQQNKQLQSQINRLGDQLIQKQQKILKMKQQIKQKDSIKLQDTQIISDLKLQIYRLQLILQTHKKQKKQSYLAPIKLSYDEQQYNTGIGMRQNLSKQLLDDIPGCGVYVNSITNSPNRIGQIQTITQRSKQDSSSIGRSKQFYQAQQNARIEQSIIIQRSPQSQKSSSQYNSPGRKLTHSLHIKQFKPISERQEYSNRKSNTSRSPAKQCILALMDQNYRNFQSNKRNSRRSYNTQRNQLGSPVRPISRSLFNQPTIQVNTNSANINQNRSQPFQSQEQQQVQTLSNPQRQNENIDQQILLLKITCGQLTMQNRRLRDDLIEKTKQFQSYKSLRQSNKSNESKLRLELFRRQLQKGYQYDFDAAQDSTYNSQNSYALEESQIGNRQEESEYSDDEQVEEMDEMYEGSGNEYEYEQQIIN